MAGSEHALNFFRRRETLGVEVHAIESNARLEQAGLEVACKSLRRYLRAAFPYFPEEGVTAVVDYLTGVDVLADVCFHLGAKDLILAEVFILFIVFKHSNCFGIHRYHLFLHHPSTKEYPPRKETFRQTMLALIGALYESAGGGSERTERSSLTSWLPDFTALTSVISGIWGIR